MTVTIRIVLVSTLILVMFVRAMDIPNDNGDRLRDVALVSDASQSPFSRLGVWFKKIADSSSSCWGCIPNSTFDSDGDDKSDIPEEYLVIKPLQSPLNYGSNHNTK